MTLLPPELSVSLVRGVRVLGGGRLLVGGSPLRAISLTQAGAGVVNHWLERGRVGRGAGRQELARRLLDAGMLSPHPDPGATVHGLTFVVPVRDRPAQLERCLRALARAAPGAPVVVVDDGSSVPVCVQHGAARVLRHATSRGPAAARNTGLSACSTPFVGFVDSDVVLPEAAASRLLAHFADPAIAAVAPRIRGLVDGGVVAGYEARHSALDMGPRGGLVAPGRQVSYIPSTVLFVRREAVGAGFEEAMRTGEDVHFVWRLHASGWRVRYAPEVDAVHEHPVSLRGFLARRLAYAHSVGMLARAHPEALPAVWIGPEAALAWTLTLTGFTGAAAATAAWSMARTYRRSQVSAGLAAELTVRGLGHSGAALGRAVRRAWSPLLIPIACRRPRARSLLAAAFAARLVQDLVETRSLRVAVRDAPLRVADELIAAAGTWSGCVRARTLRPLLPCFRSPAR